MEYPYNYLCEGHTLRCLQVLELQFNSVNGNTCILDSTATGISYTLAYSVH